MQNTTEGQVMSKTQWKEPPDILDIRVTASTAAQSAGSTEKEETTQVLLQIFAKYI